MKYYDWVILGFFGILLVPSIIGLTYTAVSAVRGMAKGKVMGRPDWKPGDDDTEAFYDKRGFFADWTKNDWENLIAGIVGVALVILLLIGFVLLLGELFSSLPYCPPAAEGDC